MNFSPDELGVIFRALNLARLVADEGLLEKHGLLGARFLAPEDDAEHAKQIMELMWDKRDEWEVQP